MTLRNQTVLLLITTLMLVPLIASADTIADMLKSYEQQGASSFSAADMDKEWNRKRISEEGDARSCATCHGSDLSKPGKHAKTGKVIDPMAKSVNAERYTDARKIEKWFLRNCKWTLGRECTAQEKGNFLLYLQSK